MTLSPNEIALIHRSRSESLARRGEFMELAQEVCEMTEIPFAKVCGLTRGNVDVCRTRNLICRIAFDRGFHPGTIARFIKRDRTTVISAIEATRRQ